MSRRTLGLDSDLYRYLVEFGTREDTVLSELREETERLPGAGMQISQEQGQFLRFLARVLGVRRALEVGVFTGYSGLCVALELPEDGSWIGCDVNPATSAVARRYFTKAGKEAFFDVRVAPAVQTLEALIDEGAAGSFDFIFVDADKENYDSYFELGLKLLRRSGVMAFDNVLWGGSVLDQDTSDAATLAIQKLNAKLKRDPRVLLSMLPIGDGLTLVAKN